VKALEEAPVPVIIDPRKLPASLPPLITAGSVTPAAAAPSVPYTSLNQFITELVALAAGPAQLKESHTIRYRLEPGKKLHHRCAVQMFPGAIALKLEGFRQQWRAQAALAEPGRFIFSVNTPPSFWQRLTGQQVGLQITVELVPAARGGSRRTEVDVLIRPFGCEGAQAVQLLADMGLAVLESIREYLQACPEQRAQERLAISHPLRVSAVLADMQLADPVEGMGKDISPRGIGFFLPQAPSTPQVYINLPDIPQVALVAGLAKIVRGQPCGDGWYEVGAFFAADEPAPK
jgi:hypothetical protein